MQRPIRILLFLALAGFGCKSTEEATQSQPYTTDAAGNVQMAAPAPGEGIQIVIDPFDVPPGSEIQRNYYRKLLTDVPFDVARIQIAMNKGTHHMNLFVTDSTHAVPDGYKDSTFTDNSVFQEANLMIEAQQQYIDWSTPTGVGIRLTPHQQMIIQTHYVNGTTSQSTPNNKGKIIINLYKSKVPVTQRASMLFAANRKLAIPAAPSATQPFDSTFAKFCYLDVVQRPIRILAMTGHFHDRGKTFIVERYDTKLGKPIDTIYKSADWDEPPFESFVDKNIVLEENQCIRYLARYVNTSDKIIPFGPRTDINEHMNLFMWFTPAYNDGQTVFDFN